MLRILLELLSKSIDVFFVNEDKRRQIKHKIMNDLLKLEIENQHSADCSQDYEDLERRAKEGQHDGQN